MNAMRVVLAAVGGTVVYFFVGFLAFALLPLKGEFSKYPAVYRSQEGIKRVMPAGMLGIFVSILVLAIL
jgi:mannose/fructose/N-acetylgalactosamine-specific phosphotransferase system component IIC